MQVHNTGLPETTNINITNKEEERRNSMQEIEEQRREEKKIRERDPHEDAKAHTLKLDPALHLHL